MLEYSTYYDDHPYMLGEPLYVRQVPGYPQDPTAYIAQGFTRTAFGKGEVSVVAFDDLYGPQYTLPIDCLTNVEPVVSFRRIKLQFRVIQGSKS